MTGRGRPPIGPPLTVRLDPELRTRLDEVAEDEEVSVAEMVRQLLHEALD